MARKADALIDKQTLTILEQLQTLTVGPPPTTSGLTGDHLPANIVSISDYDLVKNQINLEVENLEALNALNTLGRITNLQGFGPIVDSGEITSATISASGSGGKVKIATPNKGQVFDIQGMDGTWNTSPSASVTFGFYIHNDETDLELLLGTTSSSSTNPAFDINDFLNAPFYVTYPFSLRATVSTLGSATDCVMNCYHVRVR